MDCIINVACGSWYPRGQDRLRAGLDSRDYGGAKIFWKDSFPDNRSHAEVPYGFKPFAFKAARDAGFKKVLWMDAAEVIEKSVQPIFDHIYKTGYFLMNNVGFNTGEWCSDAALEGLKITREESFAIPHLMACVMGVDFDKPVCNDFLDQWLALANDKKTFPGKHTNANGEVSTDKRVRGHRHDQTAASVLSLRLGMKEWVEPFPWIWYPCWANEAGRENVKRDTVIMTSNGGSPDLRS